MTMKMMINIPKLKFCIDKDFEELKCYGFEYFDTYGQYKFYDKIMNNRAYRIIGI